MVNKLLSEGYKVSASQIGYPNGVPEFNKYKPDIYAEKGGKGIIIEAETSDSLKDKETRLRWKAFDEEEGVGFSIIVPKSCIAEAKELAKDLKVEIKDYWKMDI